MSPSQIDLEVPKLIYSIGTGQRNFAQFIELFKEHHIEAGIDLRRFPSSRFPHFSKEALAMGLESEGIQYIYLGKELGGFRKEGYLRYMESDVFQKGLARLEEIGRKKRAAFFCSETFPWRCHRRWVSRELVQRGWQVIHLLGGGKVWVPKGHHGGRD